MTTIVAIGDPIRPPPYLRLNGLLPPSAQPRNSFTASPARSSHERPRDLGAVVPPIALYDSRQPLDPLQLHSDHGVDAVALHPAVSERPRAEGGLFAPSVNQFFSRSSSSGIALLARWRSASHGGRRCSRPLPPVVQSPPVGRRTRGICRSTPARARVLRYERRIGGCPSAVQSCAEVKRVPPRHPAFVCIVSDHA